MEKALESWKEDLNHNDINIASKRQGHKSHYYFLQQHALFPCRMKPSFEDIRAPSKVELPSAGIIILTCGL